MCGDVRIKRLGGKHYGLAGMIPLPHWSIGSEWLIRQPHKGKRGGNTKSSKILSRIPIGLLESDPRKSQPKALMKDLSNVALSLRCFVS